MLPDDPKQRKEYPLYSGLLKYFPDALAEVSHLSFVGNRQHNGDAPLHWAKEKSTDEPDALMRHLLYSGTIDTDGVRHSTKVAWRALALLQREIEAEQSTKPVSMYPGTVLEHDPQPSSKSVIWRDHAAPHGAVIGGDVYDSTAIDNRCLLPLAGAIGYRCARNIGHSGKCA